MQGQILFGIVIKKKHNKVGEGDVVYETPRGLHESDECFLDTIFEYAKDIMDNFKP